MKVRIFIGPNGSGKSSVLSLLQSRGVNTFYFVNADIIAQEIVKGFELPFVANKKNLDEFIAAHPLNKKASLNTCAKSLKVIKTQIKSDSKINSYCAATIADFLRRELTKNNSSFSFESVFSDKSKIEFVRKLKKQGYRVYVYLVSTTDPLLNIQRVKDRVSKLGHDVPEDKILSRWQKSLDNAKQIKKYSDRFFVIDNSQNEHPELVAEIENGKKIKYLNKTYQPNWTKKFIK